MLPPTQAKYAEGLNSMHNESLPSSLSRRSAIRALFGGTHYPISALRLAAEE